MSGTSPTFPQRNKHRNSHAERGEDCTEGRNCRSSEDQPTRKRSPHDLLPRLGNADPRRCDDEGDHHPGERLVPRLGVISRILKSSR